MEWNNRSAYIFVKCNPDQTEKLWRRCTDWPHAIGAWVVTGDFDLLVWHDAANPDEMRKRASEIRDWEGVQRTSSHFVHQGHKNGKWWWEKPTGAWILSRDRGWQKGWKDWAQWDDAVSTVSIPGPWDYLTWVWGKDWDETWGHILAANTKGWETATLVPVRSWWNEKWKDNWWSEG